jgi:hypothetical protein
MFWDRRLRLEFERRFMQIAEEIEELGREEVELKRI